MSRFRLMWRKSLNVLMLTLTGVAAFAVVSVLFLILGYLIYNGGKSLNWDFFTQLPKPVGETGGGMANAIVGSLKLLLLPPLMGLPVGLMAGVYLAEFGGKTFSFIIRYTTDLLNGVPSIVIGIFAYSLVVVPGAAFLDAGRRRRPGHHGDSHYRAQHRRVFARCSGKLREGAMALGASKWRTIATVILPAASGGIVTGMLLALARVAGETAPLLFTAFGNSFWSPGWGQPTSSLPVMIYTYAICSLRRLAPAGMGCRLGAAWVLVLIANLGMPPGY